MVKVMVVKIEVEQTIWYVAPESIIHGEWAKLTLKTETC